MQGLIHLCHVLTSNLLHSANSGSNGAQTISRCTSTAIHSCFHSSPACAGRGWERPDRPFRSRLAPAQRVHQWSASQLPRGGSTSHDKHLRSRPECAHIHQTCKRQALVSVFFAHRLAACRTLPVRAHICRVNGFICFAYASYASVLFTLLTPHLVSQWVWIRLVGLPSHSLLFIVSNCSFARFENLASAEKCIESLRKYRNLHPSFSKVSARSFISSQPTFTNTDLQQVHKIPGTAYASVPSSISTNTGPADSFKAKMEQLGDRSSTNLYMEGLPLSITEQMLHALVTPYRIMSSRFFHTRLSSPPRIIAFVR